ncbi:pseudouridine synthase [Russula emetica]|nr:pseudouridine synthase [Russula emetica]
MGLGKTGSAVAYYYGRAASAGPARRGSTFKLSSTTTQSRRTSTRTCGRTPAGVLYIDRGVIVLNKPPGLVSQGTSSSVLAPVTVAAKTHLQETTTSLPSLQRAYDLSTKPYPVHRLDKGTTGVLVLARTKALARELSQQFRERVIEKSYLALVIGDSRSFSPAKEGLIDASLSFDDGRVRLGPGSKAARTTWEVLASSDVASLSLVRLYPHTGLKHQLRVHMAHALKVPILGDALYGGATTTSQRSSAYAGIPEGRLFLHSSSISFWRYRRNGLRKRFRLTISAPLPADFVKICRDMNLGLPENVIEGGAFVDGQRLLGDEIPGVEGRWLGGHSPCNWH